MIDKVESHFKLECDGCGESVAPFESFTDAVEWKRDNNWKSINEPNGWIELCPDCWDLYRSE